jgi:hypothetical protein
MQLSRGGIIALTGPTRSGKSALLRKLVRPPREKDEKAVSYRARCERDCFLVHHATSSLPHSTAAASGDGEDVEVDIADLSVRTLNEVELPPGVTRVGVDDLHLFQPLRPNIALINQWARMGVAVFFTADTPAPGFCGLYDEICLLIGESEGSVRLVAEKCELCGKSAGAFTINRKHPSLVKPSTDDTPDLRDVVHCCRYCANLMQGKLYLP